MRRKITQKTLAIVEMNKRECAARQRMFLRAYAKEPQSVRSCALSLGLNDRTVRRWLFNDLKFKAAVIEIVVNWHIDELHAIKAKIALDENSKAKAKT